MIKVVVVDDSAFMRKAISGMLSKSPDIEVVATAKNGQEGLDAVRRHDPDVVTLDIEMPVMDGLTALKHIMMEMPRPVCMISSLTSEGAEATLKAMELGAMDFIPKELSKVSLDIVKIEADLHHKVKTLAKRRRSGSPVARLKTKAEPKRAYPAPARGAKVYRDVVAIGVSTGGPPAVQNVLSSFAADFPAAILIAQHMPAAFTGPFANRLDNVSKIRVKEAEDGEPLTMGTAYVSPGGKHLRLVQRGAMRRVSVSEEPADALYKPCVNVLMESVAETAGRRSLGVILTGMGSDGLEGIRTLKSRGAFTMAQDEASCVVYGMPKSIVEAGLADEVIDIHDIGSAILHRLYQA